MSTLNVASINSGPIGGMRNALINGNPTINQRGYVSGTATSGANEYTLDRWRVVTSGQSITWTDSQNVRTVTAPAGGVEQVVEGINLISGSYVLSWTGTATATVAGSSVANGATVTLVGGVDTTVRFSNGTFALAQLEPGTRATPFERRSFGQELALCQRYFFSNLCPGSSMTGYWQGGSFWISTVPFPVTMRVAPTLVNSAFNGQWVHPGTTIFSAFAVHTFTLRTSTSTSYSFAVNRVAGNNTPGVAGSYSWEQEITLQFTAEL